MQRYKCIVSYDGAGFAGYQIQPHKRTVQGELEYALKKLHKGHDVKVSASGRTDAGVHAKGQVIHFDSFLKIPVIKWEKALNSLLPDDISIITAEAVEKDFHARFDAKGKEYRYYVQLSPQKDPFKRHYVYQFPFSINIQDMKEGAKYLVGSHDFTSFCSAKTEVENRVREIREIELFEDGELLVFRFVGSGFLYNMVRILVGTLLDIGSGVRKSDEIPEILEKRDRSFAGKTAPAQGLYLWEVYY